MYRANLTGITILVLLLAVATVAISLIVSEDAFAKERYSTGSNLQTQANSNECDNSALCAITSPLIQGDRSLKSEHQTHRIHSSMLENLHLALHLAPHR